MDSFQDKQVRSAAFKWLAEQVDLHGDVLPRDLLAQGFIIHDHRIPLLGPQGILVKDTPENKINRFIIPWSEVYNANRHIRLKRTTRSVDKHE